MAVWAGGVKARVAENAWASGGFSGSPNHSKDEARKSQWSHDGQVATAGPGDSGALSTPASEVMIGDVQTCAEDDNLADAAAQMANQQIRRLVVTRDSGTLVGILSLGDIAVDYGAKVAGKTLELRCHCMKWVARSAEQ